MNGKHKIYGVDDKIEKLFFLEKIINSFSDASIEIVSKDEDASSLYNSWLNTRMHLNNLSISYSTHKNSSNKKIRIYTYVDEDINIEENANIYVLFDRVDLEFILKNKKLSAALLGSNNKFSIKLHPEKLFEIRSFLENDYFPTFSVKLGNGKTLKGFAGGYFELFDLGKDIINTKISGKSSFTQNSLKVCTKSYKKNISGLVDGIIYIPSTKYGLLMDNFAKDFSLSCCIPILSKLMKSRSLMEQKKLKKISYRHDNMHEAFKCMHPENVKNKSILLLDDVWASGATMCETATYLYSLGAKKIYALVIAKKERYLYE